MPATSPIEPAIVTFASELDALVEKYCVVLDQVEISLVLSGTIGHIIGSAAEPAALCAMVRYYESAHKKMMAKAALRPSALRG